MNDIGAKNNMGRFASSDSVVLTRILPGSPDLVWRYLTEPERLSSWLAGGVLDGREGGRIDLDFDLIRCPGRENMHGTMSGAITGFQAPELLAYTWNEGGNSDETISYSVVTFKLEPVGAEQTKLTLTHTRIRGEELSGIAAGWHVHLDVLEHRLSNTQPEHFEREFQKLEPEYRSLL